MSRPARRPQTPSAAVVEPLEPRRLLTFYRVTTADDVVADDGQVSFREAYIAAEANRRVADVPAGQGGANDVIRIDRSLAGATFDLGRSLRVTDGLIVLGSGATFSGNGRHGIFDVQLARDEQVVFDSVVFRDGVAGSGGAIRLNGGSDGQGGVRPAVDGARLGIRGGQFRGNRATGGPGGGAVQAEGGTVVVRDASFVGNSAEAADGGAVHTSGTALTVERSLFQANSAARDGGAISARGSRDPVRIANTRLLGNTAGRDGGGLDVNFVNATVVGVTAVGNAAEDDGGGLAGSAISRRDGFIDIDDSLFDRNRAGDSGGGVFVLGFGTIDGSTLSGNRADRGGGLGFFDSQINTVNGLDSNLLVRDTLIRGNTASTLGGGADMNGLASFERVTIAVNVAPSGGGLSTGNGSAFEGGGEFSDGLIAQNRATAGRGGGVEVREFSGAFVSLGGTTVRDNTATGDGGGIYNGGDEFFGGLTLRDATVTGNIAGVDAGDGVGGGVFTDENSETLRRNGVVIDNTPDNFAGPGTVS